MSYWCHSRPMKMTHEEVGSDGRSTPYEECEPIYAWIFARAGILLAPLVAEHWNQPRPWTNRQISVFCPAAIQADYLEGLMQKSQLRNQAKSQSCLNDLFSTLYWVWGRALIGTDQSRSSNDALSLSQPAPSGSQPDLDVSETLASANHLYIFDAILKKHSHVPDKEDVDASDHGCGSVPAEGFFGSTKRRIIPPRRRKTITGLQWTKSPGSGTVDSQSGSPLTPNKFNGPFRSNTLRQNGTSGPLMMSQDALVPSPSHSALPRWRPWAPQNLAQLNALNDLTTQDRAYHVQLSGFQPQQQQQQLRVLVMDEATNQIQYQSYPLRPNLTVNELE
ncbi:unnamed protein product [Echinostoma caproni]|uniref:Bestrophin homolog n=1 Tax=Echinostoma caproni TaxID=27848 RepID=A0A183A577_9TREM|nr:unnamed protein product [Echinostoma caproni]